MSLKDVGQKLQEERIKQGLSLEEVERRSKINQAMLNALEDGDLGILPHQVYVRGFLKTYAQVLGLDPEDPELGLITAMEGFDSSHRSDRRERPLTEVTPYPMQTREGRRRRRSGSKPLVILLVVAVLAVGGYFLWQAAKEPILKSLRADNATNASAPAVLDDANATGSPGTGGVAPGAPRRPAQPANAPLNPAQARPTTVGNASQGDIAAQMAMQAANQTAVDEPGQISPEAVDERLQPPRNATALPPLTADEPDSAAAVQPEPASEDAPAPTETLPPESDPEKQAALERARNAQPVVVQAPTDGGEQVVEVVAVEPCWIGFTIDQDAQKDFYLYAGQRAVLRFDKTLVLRLGNAGGVRFFYNEKPIVTDYASGEVREVRFPPAPE